jgi:hypothetical protein
MSMQADDAPIMFVEFDDLIDDVSFGTKYFIRKRTANLLHMVQRICLI